jgi:tRNA modification GTPase
VVIYGATNAGKSSLLNQLLGHERVIVSETHGTTRDTIEESVNLKGFPIRLIDTAGLREAADQVEQKGIARTEKSLQQADLRLRVVDASLPKPQGFDAGGVSGAELLILNKTDLPEHSDWRDSDAIRISCVTRSGIPELERQILARIGGSNLYAESTVAINTRHRECLRRALDSCNQARDTMSQHLAPEYVAVDLKSAMNSLGEILGVIDVEQVLDSVFSQFCIGK